MLQILSQLPKLRRINFSHQFLYSALPANLSFASLESLTLHTTYLMVRMDRSLCPPCIFAKGGTRVCHLGHEAVSIPPSSGYG